MYGRSGGTNILYFIYFVISTNVYPFIGGNIHIPLFRIEGLGKSQDSEGGVKQGDEELI